MTTLAVDYRPVGALIPYVNNARTHDDAQVAQIAASIREFGFTNPILVDGKNGIIAGHGRLMAARKLGMETVPVIELAGLSDAQKKAYVLADNQLALNADWQLETLSNELHGLNSDGFNLEIIGFDADELTRLMFDPHFEPGTEDDQGKLDELAPKMVCCPGCGHTFDSRGHEQG